MARAPRSIAASGPRFHFVPPSRWRFLEHGVVGDAARRARQHREATGGYEGAERRVEEFVRQWALQWLVEAVGLPGEWLGSRILIEEPIAIGSTYKGVVDISIKRQDRQSVAFVETKARGKLRGKTFAPAVDQLASYMSAAYSSEYGVVTDGDTTIFLRRRERPRGIEEVPAAEAEDFLRGLRQAAGVDERPVTASPVAGPVDGFLKGAFYTRRQIHEVVGGSLQSYLPTVDGRVVAGCFVAVLNPSVPYEILVGDGPVILNTARVLADQEEPIPVFVKQGVNRWEYLGRFRATGYSEDRCVVDPRAEAAGRRAEAVLTLAAVDHWRESR